MKFGIFLIRKQIRQIGCERAIRGFEFPVRVLPPALRVGCLAALVEEHLVFCVPHFEQRSEIPFVHLVQGACKLAQCLPGFRLGSARQIFSDRLHLVELAKLHWSAALFKNLCHASPTVDDGCSDLPTAIQKPCKTLFVDGSCFLLHFSPTQVAFE